MQLIDIGVNLTHDSFDHDRTAVLERAAQAGVAQMIVTGSTGASTRAALELARALPGRLFATAGVHPHHATELDDALLTQLAGLARAPEIVAIGECGLDYFRDYSPRDVQRRAFERQLDLASRIGKPVFLHQRDAHEDFLAIVGEHRHGLAGGVAHCFTGSAEQVEAYLALGLAVGITGWICDERRGTHLPAVVRRIPKDRLMLETDAPYLLPRDLRPRPHSGRNEPAFLVHVARAVASARGVSLEELAEETTASTRKLFRISGPSAAEDRT